MGYRLYFYEIPKELVTQISNASSFEEAKLIAAPNNTDPDYLGIYEFEGLGLEYEFGKEHDAIQAIERGSRTLRWFHDMDRDSYCRVGTHNMVLRALEHYRQKVINYHRESDGREADYASKIRWLESEFLFDLGQSSYDVTGVWLYEYSMFNLVNFYKKIDWNKSRVLFTGW